MRSAFRLRAAIVRIRIHCEPLESFKHLFAMAEVYVVLKVRVVNLARNKRRFHVMEGDFELVSKLLVGMDSEIPILNVIVEKNAWE